VSSYGTYTEIPHARRRDGMCITIVALAERQRQAGSDNAWKKRSSSADSDSGSGLVVRRGEKVRTAVALLYLQYRERCFS